MENKTLDSLLIEANHNVTRIGFDNPQTGVAKVIGD